MGRIICSYFMIFLSCFINLSKSYILLYNYETYIPPNTCHTSKYMPQLICFAYILVDLKQRLDIYLCHGKQLFIRKKLDWSILHSIWPWIVSKSFFYIRAVYTCSWTVWLDVLSSCIWYPQKVEVRSVLTISYMLIVG